MASDKRYEIGACLMTQPFRLNMARQIDSLIKSGPKLVWIINIAFILRIACSVLIQIVATRRGTVCLFGDTPIYWEYAKSIANGTTYVVYQWDVPHYALRTPGYPAWLAGWIAIFGEWALPIRIGQSILSVCGILWLYKLAKVVGFSEQSARWSSTFLAFDPFQIVSTPLLLTESIFTPLLVLFVLVWVKALKSIQNLSLIKHNYFHYILLGVLQGVLTLIRPAWLPFIAILDLSFLWLISSQKHGLLVLASLLLIQAGWALPIVPWMARNESVIGRTSLGGTWGGASLYDGLQPTATGSSDMSFVADLEYRDLSETAQDDLWKFLSYQAIQDNPNRIARLAIQKQIRFWSAWPNDSAKVPLVVKATCLLIVWPVWGLMLLGFWKNLHQRMVFWVLSPLFFSALMHLLFVGSSRYRLAVILPAMILTGEGFTRILRIAFKRSPELN